MLHTILKFLVSLFSALSRAADASTSDPASTVDTKTSAISTGAGIRALSTGHRWWRQATRGHAQDREHQPQALHTA